MQSAQESKNELQAAIRYAENAISAAQATIESIDFRQEMAKKNYMEQTGREAALEAENAKLREHKERLTGLEIQLRDKIRELKEGKAVMPVIPKDVAIAIFREGVRSGVNDAVSELEGQTINISESEYVGDFEVSFTRDIDLDDELDFDWMRDKVGQYNEEFVIDSLRGLCASKEFKCRIHGIDDND